MPNPTVNFNMIFIFSTITPLLRYELWSSIVADMGKDQKVLNNRIRITFNDVTVSKRGEDVRNVYHCEGTNSNMKITSKLMFVW